MACDDFCKRCCYSTPFSTLFALGAIIVGGVGFVGSSIYGIVTMSSTNNLSQHVIIFGPVIGGLVIITILPLLLSTIMAYCVTGYIRDELFAGFIKRFIGPCCSFFSMCLNLIFFFLWLLMTVIFSALLTIVVQLRLSCAERDSFECLPDTNYTFVDQICGPELDTLCDNGNNIGISFVTSLVFVIIIVFGLVITLMIQSANYVNARENMEYRRSYQPRNNASTDYMMKSVN